MLKLHDLNPDGVRIIVDWDSIKTGMSVFILCVNTEKAVKQLAGRKGAENMARRKISAQEKAIKQIKNIVQSKRWKVETRVVIEDGKLGVRIWRVL